MKKQRMIFIGECIVIVALLLVIGLMFRKEDVTRIPGRERAVIVEDALKQEGVNENSAFDADVMQAAESSTEIIEEMETEQLVETVAEDVQKNEMEEIEAGQSEIKTVDQYDITKIVVFGDSIWNAGRGENGISEQIMEELNVEVYNCAIGGTSAAIEDDDITLENWDSKSLNGMMYIANGLIDADELIGEDAACEVIKSVDFEEIDYVIVSYGLNDYFSDIKVYPDEYYDLNSYVGALRHGIRKLQKNYPNIKVILTSPTYCEWFKGERQYELGMYTESARSVAEELDLYFLDMYHALGDTPDEKTQYLSDGVHLTDEGLTLYANWVIENLKGMGIETK